MFVGAFGAGWDELGKYPFRIRRSDFDPGHGGPALGVCGKYATGLCACSVQQSVSVYSNQEAQPNRLRPPNVPACADKG